MNHALYHGEVFRKPEKGKTFYQSHNFEVNTTIKTEPLFQLLICKVNEFDLKQYFF